MKQTFCDSIPVSEADEIQLRKYQNNIITCGKGIMIFSVWSVIKLCFYLLLDSSEMLGSLDLPVLAVVLAVLAVMQGADVLLRLYISGSAKKYALGIRKSVKYLFVSILPALFSFISVYTYILQLAVAPDTGYEINGDVILSLVIELTSLLVFVLLAVNSLKLRKYKKTVKGA